MEESEGIKNISEFLGKQFLEKFKIVWRETLFEPAWEVLKVDRCPICGNKLKFPKAKKIAYCNGKRHKKSFVINVNRLNELKTR